MVDVAKDPQYEGALDLSMFDEVDENVLLYSFFTLFEQSPGSQKHKTIAFELDVDEHLAEQMEKKEVGHPSLKKL